MTAALVAAALCVVGCGGCKDAGPRERAQDALAAGKAAQARDILKKAIDSAPEDPGMAAAYNDLGVAYQRLQSNEEAIVAFENSRRLEPLLSHPTYNLGVMLHERGDTERATTLFREAS